LKRGLGVLRWAPNMNETPQSGSGNHAGEMMWGFWYPALRTEEVRARKLVRAMLLGVPLVLGRDNAGKPFALRDVCPHRAFPLSFGQFDGAAVECAYHGWQFEAHTGQCRAIPSLTADSKLKCERIYAGAFPCEECDGYVWAFMANPEGRASSAPPPPAPELPTFSPHYQIAHLWADLPCGVDQAIIGLMDPAHGPFVHQAWWWRSRHSIREKQKQFEPIPNGFRMSAHAPSANSAPYKILKLLTGEPATTMIDFVLRARRPLPPRFLRRVEHPHLVSGGFVHHSRIWAAIYSTGYRGDQKASAGIEIRGAHDAGGRRRPPSTLVFRAESRVSGIAAHWRAHAKSRGRSGHFALAILVRRG